MAVIGSIVFAAPLSAAIAEGSGAAVDGVMVLGGIGLIAIGILACKYG